MDITNKTEGHGKRGVPIPLQCNHRGLPVFRLALSFQGAELAGVDLDGFRARTAYDLIRFRRFWQELTRPMIAVSLGGVA